MSTILMIHGNRSASGVQYIGISSISAHLKRAGHKLVLFDTAWYEHGTAQRKGSTFLKHKEVSATDKPLLQKKPVKTLVSDLLELIEQTKPDLIGFSCFTSDWPFVLFLLRLLYNKHTLIPRIVGGVHATTNPEQVFKHPEVSMICIGEGEDPLIELMDSIRARKLNPAIKNIWFKNPEVKNDMRKALDLNSDLPYPDNTIFKDSNFLFPYMEKVYRRGSVSFSRGCPHSCTFCINGFYKKHKKLGYGVRTKKIQTVVNEIKKLKCLYDVNFLRFHDENFLAFPTKQLREFAAEYLKWIRLPFSIETTANLINEERAELLYNMGCVSVSIGVETSNEKLRKRVLKKQTSNKQYTKAFNILDKFSIRKVANFMFFLPGQTTGDMYQDILWAKRWGIDSANANIFYPYQGTPLRKYCIDKGLINIKAMNEFENEDKVKSIEDLENNPIVYKDTVLNFSEETKKTGLRFLDNFSLLQELPLDKHNDVVISIIKDDTEKVNRIKEKLYFDKFGGCK